MCLAWCLVEIPRYTFYAVNLVMEVPFFLKWIRYSLFYILYPMGITGELCCIYNSLGYLQTNQVGVLTMPNSWNFSYQHYYAVVAAALLYLPGSPFLYMHMIVLRTKQLAGKPKDAKPKAQ